MMRDRGRLIVAVGLAASVAAVGLAVSAVAGTSGARARIVKVASGFDSPVLVTHAPGERNRLYVVEQTGRIRVLMRGKAVPAPFLDVRREITAGGEQGLLGLAFAPDYATSRLLVVNYTDRQGDTQIVSYRSKGARAIPGTARPLLTVEQPYPNHNGGMVAFGPDGLLYVGMGDGGSGGDPEDRAQDPASMLGKLIRLDPRVPTPKAEIVALGLRNPWRFSFDRTTGDLWIGDVGQGDIEEVDFLPRSALAGLADSPVNFGWDVYEGRAGFERKPLGPGRLIKPVAQYHHSLGCSITGGYVYRGAAVPAKRGRYFFGDYCSGTVWSMTRAGSPRREGFRVESLTSFGEDGAGELYLVSGDGTIFRLAP